ncbi:hypothetical protein NP493_1763g00001 [Ridgeia piscesae]|uniref:Fibronectin type-III domain-containing protein n=1 Tax=Ridgeia piscesae TaxID=27915 RepID=A0AAD9JT55_RIDPI|nr:hypothetical protein NP493_1763g00001 [Ridgeia piscesae]
MVVCGRLLLCVVLLAVCQNVVEGWSSPRLPSIRTPYHLSGRIRRGFVCKEVDCEWGGWSGWGACSQPCGKTGTQYRYRSVSTEARCHGSGCSGSSSDSQSCYPGCVHGTVQDGYCSDCPTVYWGRCCNHPCKTIDNCRELECTSGTNQFCHSCEYTYSKTEMAYRLVARDGHDNRVCEISTKPSVTYCLITAEVDVGSSVENVEISCADESNPVVYSNVVATTLKSNPETGLLVCNLKATTMNPPLQHADRLHFEAATSNGGYVTINNIENNNIDPAIYYSGQTTTHKAELTLFLIFDNVNVVSINTAEDKILVVNSAAENTSYTWLTSLQSSSYTGDQASHFANVFHNTHKFLNGSAANSPPINPGYEELTGQPPDTVSREAIPNVNGIVKYEVSHAVDNDGGCSLNSSDSWRNVDDFQSEQILLDIPRADGDSVRVWVRATDVMGNTKTDSVLVHVDSSPPVIQDVWLSRHGRTQLAVHHSTDLSDLKFEFESYDYHSGLKEIHWRLHDSVDPDLTHGDGHVAVRRHKGATPDCVAPQCYCIPKDEECFWRNFEIKPDMSKMVKPHGDHDFDYDLVITSTNNAMLTTVFTYKITVDTTAPHTGVVSDSEQSQPDIDFQQEFTQHASWQGFFDRESGVMFYQYVFSDACLTAKNFTVPPTNNVNETTLTYASRTVSGPGTYHCTVVAYNKALEPSEPVCSDGVTVDTTAPEIHEVSIENSWTKDGLVKDSTGHVWYIDRNRFRVLVEQPSDSCRQKAREESNISLLYRIRQLRKSSGESNMTMCQKAALPDKPVVLVSKQNMLELSWFGSDDESGIYAYEVGLSSTGSEDMDLLPYTSTHGHRHFITYHPDLMDGQTFYIHIKAVNRAGQQTVQVIGPVLVEVDAPTFLGDISLSVQQKDGVEYLIAKWDRLSFEASELKDGLLYDMNYAVGHLRGTDNVKRFVSLTQHISVPGLCTWTEPPTCVATPVDKLQWRLHGRHSYYVTLKLEGINHVERVVTSEVYVHYIGPPFDGIVVEIPVDTTEVLSEDIDHQSNQSHLHITWHDFHHFDQTINYQLAVGTDPGIEDVVGFTDVAGPSHMLTGLTLQPFQTYYACIRARTQDGTTTSCSDGVTVLPVATRLEDEPQTVLSMSHHDFSLPNKSCVVDIDFQSSLTYVGIRWTLPTNVTTYITNVKWGVQPLFSDGVTVTPDAPVSNGFTSVSLTDTNLTFTWHQFVDPSIPSSASPGAVISRQEWTLLAEMGGGRTDNVLLEKNALWRQPDREYTPSVSTLSAVWPDLRHGTYAWKVVSDRAIHRFAFVEPRTAPDYGDFDCSAPEVLACGETQNNFMNVHDLNLREGQRYYICILANATDLEFEKFTQHLEQNSECSNGIVVDTTPPTAGQVWVGSHLQHWRYQIDRSQLNIYWSSFVDVETFGLSSHHSGIFKYEYAVGTSPEGVDVRDYVDVGVTNMAVATGLTLQEGHTYYVTIRATDHVGRSTTTTSQGVTIDSTPPDVTKVPIDVGSAYITEQRELSPTWSGVFEDTESGPQDNLHLTDGHPVYVTVQAVNRVGLTAVTTSRAVIVDTTSPLAGHVYDVISDGQNTDSDYTTYFRTTLSAHWLNFHDPESGLLYLEWRAGTTPGQSDILAPTRLHVTDRATTTLTDPLPVGKTVYVTLKVVNKAGTTSLTHRYDQSHSQVRPVSLTGTTNLTHRYDQSHSQVRPV